MDVLYRIRELIEKLNKYSYEYYINNESSVSDQEYDKLYDELILLEKQTNIFFKDSPTQKVGSNLSNYFKKHKHIKKLLSLDKATTIDELKNFDKNVKKIYNGNYITEYKFDGLTICVTYNKGEFVCASTRGDGYIGEDVTQQALNTNSFPKHINYNGIIEIQGEAIIQLSKLEEYNKKSSIVLKNARNAAAGAIRNLDVNDVKNKHVEIIFYNINYIEDKSLIKTQEAVFKFLEENNFNIHPYRKICNTLDDVMLEIEKINIDKYKINYLIDGCVIKVNNIDIRDDIGETEKHPKWAIAYKYNTNETATILKSVTWQIGRTGKLTPVAEFDPIDICGATIKNATLNNYSIITKKDIKINSKILIRRTNDVIPEIIGVVENNDDCIKIEKPVICPSCKQQLKYDGINLFCINNNCDDIIISKLLHFVSNECANIIGIDKKIIKDLYYILNIKTYSDIYTLTKQQLLSLNGFSILKASTLINEIETKKSILFYKFINALNIFGVGLKCSKLLSKKFNNIQKLRNATYEELTQIQDIGDVIAHSIINFFNDQNNLKEINKLTNILNIKYDKNDVIDNVYISNKKFVITGSFKEYKREDVKQMIENNNGIVNNKVTKKTDYVIVGDNPGNNKNLANELNIKIITLDDLLKMIN